ncbi:Baf family transcriptional acitvator [Nitzschia inconspicua]|uniref:Baf family transcriptional acitvator n=1 Tax=Nitzschia inconspicua TaxID=303405 RepID=A0A9K3Q7M0_9STRA|nr:Baf family transcriptional acitvator [Nitzschia inconspicua]
MSSNNNNNGSSSNCGSSRTTTNNNNNSNIMSSNSNNNSNVLKLKSIPPAADDWSRNAPSPFEDMLLTVVCGNSNYHWALHLGVTHKFVPSLFWNTPHSDEDEENYQKEDPCDLLMAHIPPQAHTLILGNKVNLGCSVSQQVNNVAASAAAKRKHSVLSIYVVSSNPDAERKLLFMFRHVPVRIHKLRNTDFFSFDQGLYETMGVDRTAVLYGAKITFGCPVLTMDGGTAMTYAALDKNGRILGGGISPGIKVRLQSLHEHTGALPNIDHKDFQQAIETAMNNKQPLPTFAKETTVAMMTTACSEIACQLRNIIQQFLVETVDTESNKEQKDVYVVITGGDGDLFRLLLQQDAAHIIETEPKLQSLPEHVKIVYSKNFAHYGIGDLLYRKCTERPINPYEELRSKLMGLRVAVRSRTGKNGISIGTVICVDSDPPTTEDPSALSSYTFLIRHDMTAKQQMLSLREFYDGLVLYDVVGEDEGKEDLDRDGLEQRKVTSKSVQEIMLDKSLALRNRKLELETYIAQGELPQFLGCYTEEEREAKRQKMASRVVIENPKRYIGMRVAKEFAVEDPNNKGKLTEAIFFGTVEYITDEAKLWYFVRYDDGDCEEYELKDIEHGLKLYDTNKEDDLTLTQEARGEVSNHMDVDHGRGGEQKIEIDSDTREATNEPSSCCNESSTMINL